MIDWLLAAYAFIIGACIGSFLNVCIYRWPAELSVLKPRSRCGACGEPIRWYDNIPILSWILLRRRCRACGASISIQYPLVELATGVIWLIAVLRFGLDVEALRSAIFLTLLLGIAMTDAREMVIPDQFSLGGTAIGLALAAVPGGMPFIRAFIGALVGYGLFWAVKLGAEKAFKKPALGVGDIHMMAMVGAFLGTAGAMLTMMLGSMAGLAIGVPLTKIRGQLAVLGTYLPLGTFLAIGAFIAHIWGGAIIDWYIGMLG